MNESLDLTTMLSNAAFTFRNQAAQCRRMAAESQRILDGFQGELYAEQERPKIERALAEAQLWEERAAEASRGYLLFRQAEYGDSSFLRDYATLVTTCQEQGRVVYGPTADSEEVRIKQNAAGGPYV
jgi:hypothetical protein